MRPIRPIRPGIELIGGFESTFQPEHDVDIAESTGHIDRRSDDLRLLADCGIERVRYPVRWHRLEREPGVFDWTETDAVFDQLHERRLRPIVDLVHHTSYPRWLSRGFADPDFPSAYLRYVEALFDRYPSMSDYTLFNEPLATLFLCGHEGIWPPYGNSLDDLIDLFRNVLPVVAEASRRCHAHRPDGLHWWCDTCERHSGAGDSGKRYATYALDRRFFVLDAVLGLIGGQGASDGELNRPFVADVIAHGGSDLLDLTPGHVDLVGLDYYAHCQWHFDAAGGTAPTPHPMPLAEQIAEYAERYERPVWLGETNLRGYPTDRASWLKYVLEQCETAVANGVDLRGVCWFPFIDSCDWDSLLRRCNRNVDPVGVFRIDAAGNRIESEMSDSYIAAARGVPARDLPAYHWRQPIATWLRGWEPQIAHWQRLDPPADIDDHGVPGDPEFAPLAVRRAG
ncbi:MAG TPA: family 1 glycosylhydrolase [Ilumatobacteraceae bacterium]|nr:family 1 glycosylhydrolase [Ilumatobacteraceae bacterium]